MKRQRRRQKALYGIGEALCLAVDTAMGARVPSTAHALHILGQKLMWIADGQDATKVFGQDKSGRPDMGERDRGVAAIYLKARVRGDHTWGLKVVRSKLPDLKLADSAVYDIVKRYKADLLGTKDMLGALVFDNHTTGEPGIHVADLDELRGRLTRGGKGNATWQAWEAAEKAAKTKPPTSSERNAMRDKIKRRNKKRTTQVLKK